MGNLMAEAEAYLADSIEGEFGMPMILVGPDGTKYATSKNSPASPLLGMVRFDSAIINTDTGERVVDPNPQVTLRRSSLTRIPVAGEKWGIWIPSGPADTTASTFWMLDTSRAPEGGLSIGIIRLYLQHPTQSASQLTAFFLAGAAGVIDQNAKTIAVTVPHGTSLSALVATFTASDSSIVYVGDTIQVSGSTPNNFTSPLTYALVGIDGTTSAYLVTVTVAAS